METINWFCLKTLKQSSVNTAWCLLGCSIGDFGTIFFFQIYQVDVPILFIMTLAILNGLITSIALETFILCLKHPFLFSLKTALGMSLLSMVSMEIAMNLTDYFYTGTAKLTPSAVALMLMAGFLTPLPYNYWRLKKFNKSCH